MKTISFILFCLLIPFVHAQSPRERISMNQDWRFATGHLLPEKDFNYGRALSFSKTGFLQEATMLEADQRSRLTIPHTQQFNDSLWEKVTLPHDWGMKAGYAENQFKVKGYRRLGGRTPENCIGWYRKTFRITADPNNRYQLEFEGIFRDAQIWINGIFLGRHVSGYTPVEFDVTECLNYGDNAENVITVRVDATHSELWSYEGAGIYRNVWLTRTAPIYIPQWGTFVTTQVADTGGEAKVNAAIDIKNETNAPADIEIRQYITDNRGKTITTSTDHCRVQALRTETIDTRLVVADACLWTLKAPHLYHLTSEVWVNGKQIDQYKTRFGIRNIRFDADHGFFLNGERVQIQGVCCHQDHAGVGIAVPDRLNYWRIERLKDYGTNAYRASHNPPTVSVLDACDSLGVLVMDEMRMLNSSREGLEQMTTVIRRDRNHPSIITWCMGNEEPAIQGNDKGRKILRRMRDIQRQLDPTRPCTAAMNGSWGEGFTNEVDIQGSNYYHIGNIDDVHKTFPTLPCLLSEEASTVTTRGIYRTSAPEGFHQAYDNDRPGWGATAQEWMRYVDQRKYVAGAFVWTGFDYGGESTIHYWPGVVSHFGILDYCGFPKDAYWYYKAWWTDSPVLHLLPHWNGIGQDTIKVCAYTNMEEAELFLNGHSLGKRIVEKYDMPEWKVKYAPGKLQLRGKKNGKQFTETIYTTDAPAALELQSETGMEARTDGNDISIITVKVIDKKNRLVPDASDKIYFEVENGTILGVGNGHPSSHEPDQFVSGTPVYRNAFGGLAQLIVRPNSTGKMMTITARSGNLKMASLQINLTK